MGDTPIKGNLIVGGYVSAGSRVLVNRVIVGTKGHYTDLKTACEVAYSAPTEILLDGGTFNVADTITINNANIIAIRGIGRGGTIIQSATGLTNKPMFTVSTDLYIDKLTIDGSVLADYGDLSTENCFNVSGSNAYVDFQNSVIVGFYDQFYFTGTGSSAFIFNSVFSDVVNSSVRVNTIGINTIDVETNSFNNCIKSFYLEQSSDGKFDIINNLFENTSNNIAIYYVPTTNGTDNYVLHTNNAVIGNKFNNVGLFSSGFDYTRTDSRDANIFVSSNAGREDKKPHAKINMIDNATTTTITNINTWYKVNFSSKVLLVLNATPTGGTFTITVGDQTTANISYDATPATMATNIKNAIDALSNVTAVTVTNITGTNILALSQWQILYTTTTEGWVYHTANIASLTSVTSAYFEGNQYTCKLTLSANKVTYQPSSSTDIIMNISANLLCNRNSVRIDLAVARYNSSNVFQGYYGRMTGTATATATTNPVVIPLNVYISDAELGDYFEIHALKTTNAGDIITLSDLSWSIDSK